MQTGKADGPKQRQPHATWGRLRERARSVRSRKRVYVAAYAYRRKIEGAQSHHHHPAAAAAAEEGAADADAGRTHI